MAAAPPTRRLAVAALAALLAAASLSACGKTHKPGEAVDEGLSTPLAGLRYTVFITRQLNLRDPEDKGYLPGMKEAAPGRGLFAIFLQACNTGHHVARAVDIGQFTIEDAEGDQFHAVDLPRTYPFAYHGRPVPPSDCVPARGSLAQQGPTSGAVLVFNLPLAATENRPLTLRIEGPPGSTPARAEVTLDI